MNLKDIIGEGDSASAVMFWTDLYLNRIGLNPLQTSNWLRRCHDIDAIVKTKEDKIGTLIEIVWGGKHLGVYNSYLRTLAERKYADALAEYSEQHGGILSVPDRLCLCS